MSNKKMVVIRDVDEEVWNKFRQNVQEKYGRKKGATGEELTKVLMEYNRMKGIRAQKSKYELIEDIVRNRCTKKDGAYVLHKNALRTWIIRLLQIRDARSVNSWISYIEAKYCTFVAGDFLYIDKSFIEEK